MTVRPAGLRIDRDVAKRILWEEAAKAPAGYVEQRWVKPIEELSEAASGQALTHIAFLGTAMLAQSASIRTSTSFPSR